jgi:hypothetical protein
MTTVRTFQVVSDNGERFVSFMPMYLCISIAYFRLTSLLRLYISLLLIGGIKRPFVLHKAVLIVVTLLGSHLMHRSFILRCYGDER